MFSASGWFRPSDRKRNLLAVRHRSTFCKLDVARVFDAALRRCVMGILTSMAGCLPLPLFLCFTRLRLLGRTPSILKIPSHDVGWRGVAGAVAWYWLNNAGGVAWLVMAFSTRRKLLVSGVWYIMASATKPMTLVWRQRREHKQAVCGVAYDDDKPAHARI